MRAHVRTIRIERDDATIRASVYGKITTQKPQRPHPPAPNLA
jgi:hypothetical protein